MKKILSLALCIIMLFSAPGTINTFAESETEVYFTLSICGELAKDKSGNLIALSSLTLSGKDSYTLDDVFKAAHESFYEEGLSGYETEETKFGLSVKKFFADESGKFSYQVNSGSEAVLGPAHQVKSGDIIDFSINESYYPDTESYSAFSESFKDAYTDKPFEIVLNQAGYDENFNMVFSGVEGATILIDGEETDIVTDAFGKASVTIDKTGEYIISAKKEKLVGENKETAVCAITAPCMKVKVTIPPDIKTLHNIAEKYSTDAILNDGNFHWFIADMKIYEELFPESFSLNEELRQKCIDALASESYFSTSPSALAKIIISLRALGCDARNIQLSNGQSTDAVKKLCDMVDEKNAAGTNIYTLPYVLIALNQHESYMTEAQRDFLISSALSQKSSWQSTEWGTDGATPMVLALSPYYKTNDSVKAALDETVEIIKSCQGENGLIGNAASTGLAICALSALGIDCNSVKSNDISLTDALMSLATDNLDGFNPINNSFSTEQGFRGLLAHYLQKSGIEKVMYDFSAYPFNEATATISDVAKVTISATPSAADITIDGASKNADGTFALAKGEYTLIASALGYYSKNVSFEITDEDIIRGKKTVSISLDAASSGGSLSGGSSSGGGGGGSSVIEVKEEETKPEEESKEEETKAEEETKTEEVKPFEYTDVKKDDWFYDAAIYVHKNKLMTGTLSGFEPESKMTRAMLITVLYRMENTPKAIKVKDFSDIEKGSWFYDAVSWGASQGIINGVSENNFAPDEFISREQIAVILYRYAELKKADVSKKADLSQFSDTSEISDWAYDALCWANASKVINETSAFTLSPKESATRAEVAQILFNISKE